MIILSNCGKEIKVDQKWFTYLSQFAWFIDGKGYAYRVVVEKGKNKNIKMHREIMSFPDTMVDHRNREKLDNRESNLREATHAQNEMNKGLRRDNKTGFKGVQHHKASGKYRVRITKDKKEYHLGLFEDLEVAKKMYNFWAIDMFGEFAVLNN